MAKIIKRAFPVLIALIMIFYPAAGVLKHVHAASFPLQLFVDSFQSGELALYWSGLPGTQSVVVTYHYPDDSGAPVEQVLVLNQQENRVTISNLQNDIIYDIDIKVYNSPDGGGTEIGQGLIYFMPRITFYATRLGQQRVPMEGGGFETGIEPGLNLRWAMPKVFNGTDFVYLDQALEHMETRINQVYADQRELGSLGFRINISTDATKLNGGSMENGLIIERDQDEYTAYVSGTPGITSKVHGPDANGFMSFDLIGRKDKESDPPAATNEYQLRDWDILPGTVYYMNIKPVFLDSEGEFQNAVTIGPQEAQNGSILSGPFSYTYTPIRFQLTRDSLNNVYVKIFKINEGSLDLPRMYYQVQTSDDPSIPGDWNVRKTLDDTYFGGEYAVTVISGVSPGNTIYYKIVVKTDAREDRLESPAMPYTLSEDLIKSPVPSGVEVTERTLIHGQVVHPETGETISLKSTDIVLTWKKPDGWESIKDDLYFHVLLSTAQSKHDVNVPLYLDGKLWGSYPVRYRLVKYISAASPNIIDNGSSLSYTISGFDLFTWEDENGDTHSIPNEEGYPDFLLPNTVYYLQMYTTNKEHRGTMEPEFMSDRSLTISFTTLRQEERDVPLPGKFSIYSNEMDGSGRNIVRIQFSGLREHMLDWNFYTSQPDAGDRIYYDLYMSTRTEIDSFILIGSTEQPGDVVFHTETTETGIYVTAAVSEFSPGSEAYSAFGERLRPNTTYYFMMKTRLSMVNEDKDKESIPTVLLPVTTLRGDILPPDETARRPLAPVDFFIAKDEDGTLKVSGTDVSLEWLRREPDASYEIICTREKPHPDAGIKEYETDPLYISFIDKYGAMDSDGDDSVFILNPDLDLQQGFFEYAPETGIFTFHVNNWLYPNRLYYFSIRAVNENGVSVWVSVPVTTKPVEMPMQLEPVTDVQAWFNWSDPDPNSRTEDFSIYIREPGDSKYRILSRSRYTITRDGSVYYARISNLEADSSYDIRVYKRENTSSPFYEIRNFKTRDNRHQLHVRWKGRDEFTYQIEIKEEFSSSYIMLDSSDYELYREKTYDTAGTGYSVFHAIIKTAALLRTSDGSYETMPLYSNTAYHVRVRSRVVDPIDPSIVSYSKFTPAIRVRTEFDQEDYDKEDEKKKKQTAFLDRISELEEDIYWRIDINNGVSCIIMLKPERTSNLLKELQGKPLVLNLGAIMPEMDSYVVYIPSDVVETGNAVSSSITFAVPGMRCALRPGWVFDEMNEVASIYGFKNVKGLYYRLDIQRANKQDFKAEGNVSLLSDVWRLTANLQGMSMSPDTIEELIHERLYDEETGLVHDKMEELLKSNSGALESETFNRYITGLVNLIKNELSIYIGNIMKSSRVRDASARIKSFGTPVVLEVEHQKSQGTIAPYARHSDMGPWNRIDSVFVSGDRGTMSFEGSGSGWYAVALLWQLSGKDMLHPFSEHILRLMGLYDLAEVFDGFEHSARPDKSVTAREAVLLYEKVTGWTGAGTLPDLGQRAKKMGLDRYMDTARMNRNITRQETAGILFLMFAAKTGMDPEYWKASSVLWIRDESDIGDKYYRPVEFCVETGMLDTTGGYFYPGREISRGEICKAVLQLLSLAGD